MSVNTVRARLNALRKNFPDRDVNEAVVQDFHSMVRELEEELPDPEISHFRVPDMEIKPRITSVAPGRGATYSREKYCDNGVFKRQVVGLWAYLEEQGVVKSENAHHSPKNERPSPEMNFYGPVTGATIQQGDHNTAVNYQNDVRQVLEEIRPLLNAAKLTSVAKQELRAEFETVEAQTRSPKPKHTIIRESLQSARHILEHAFGAGLGHAYFPLLVEFFKHH